MTNLKKKKEMYKLTEIVFCIVVKILLTLLGVF